jgi:hypothetical protein
MKTPGLLRCFGLPVVFGSFSLMRALVCQAVVLVDNGPLITHAGGGFGGADASALQTSLGLNSYGFNMNGAASFRVDDDFSVPAGEVWDITSIEFFGYQTFSSTTSTFTSLNFQVWNTTSVVFGDTTTDRLSSTSFTGIYRVLDSGLTANDRPIMSLLANISLQLTSGTYWLDWQALGSLGSGPWVPPISILGTTDTGNATQSTDNGATWAAIIDTGTSSSPQGLPFKISGTITVVPEIGAYPLVFALLGFGGLLLRRSKA